jgi:hypothetical protein
MIGLVTCFSRSASVTVKFGIKALSMLSSLALTLVIVSGCTEDTPPAAPSTPTVAPSKAPGPDKAAPAPIPPPTKAEEKK